MHTGSNKQKGHFIGCLTKKETTLRGYYIGLMKYFVYKPIFLIVSVACRVFTWTVSQGFPAFLRRLHPGAQHLH